MSGMAESLARWVLEMNVWTALVLAIVIASDKILAPRVGASWRSLLYAAVLLRLCIPLETTAALGLAAPEVRVADVVPVGMPEIAALGAAQEAPRATGPSALAIAGLAHATGAFLLMLRWLAGRSRLARIAGESRVLAGEPGGAPPVHVHDSWGPGLVGIARPRLVVPEALLAAGPAPLDWVRRHELAHLRRGDHVTLPLLQLVVMLAWPVLPLWLALLRYRRLVEMACDETALAGEPSRRRREYGELLLSLSSRATWSARFDTLQEVSMSRDVVSRIVELRHQRRFASRIQGLLVLPIAAVAALAVGPGATGSVAASPDPAGGAGVDKSAERSCQDTIRAVVDQFRYLKVVRLVEGSEGVTIGVELQVTDERDASKVISSFKDALDKFGFVVVSMRGMPPRTQEGEVRALPFEVGVECPSADRQGPGGDVKLGLRCPERGKEPVAQLRDALAALGASPRIAAEVALDGERVRLSGSAESIPVIAALVGELERCPTLKDVDLRYVKADEKLGYLFETVASVE